MKFTTVGTKPDAPAAAVVRQDSKCRKAPDGGELLPIHVLQGKKARCAPIRALLGSAMTSSWHLFTKSCVLWLTISLLLGLVALVLVGSVLIDGHLLSRISYIMVRVSFYAGREWRCQVGAFSGRRAVDYAYPGLMSPFMPAHPSPDYNGFESRAPDFPPSFGAITNGSSALAMAGPDFDVCLMVSVGDDGDGPSQCTLPYGLVLQLTDAARDEATGLRVGRQGQVRVLVDVDYGVRHPRLHI